MTAAADALPLQSSAAKLTGTPRVVGYDVARAVAVLSMVVDHASRVLGPERPGAWGAMVQGWLDGRASAVFVFLAGVGVSLMSRRQDRGRLRSVLVRRGALLLGIGFLNQALWQGDILRVFGVAIMLAGFLVGLSSRALIGVAVAIFLAFPALYLTFDFDARWDLATMRYRGLWSPAGIVRNLMFDGFRPVVPWAGLLVLGMWVGRLDVTRPSVRRGMLFWGVSLVVAAEATSHALLRFWLANRGGFSEETIDAWADTGSMPPLPMFLLTATGTALAATALGLMAGAWWPASRIVRTGVATGQMALTWYCGHILLGALIVWRFGWHPIGSVGVAMGLGVIGFGVIVVASVVLKGRFRTGPMEWLLRRVG